MFFHLKQQRMLGVYIPWNARLTMTKTGHLAGWLRFRLFQHLVIMRKSYTVSSVCLPLIANVSFVSRGVYIRTPRAIYFSTYRD